jgi:hypothetical protein
LDLPISYESIEMLRGGDWDDGRSRFMRDDVVPSLLALGNEYHISSPVVAELDAAGRHASLPKCGPISGLAFEHFANLEKRTGSP